MRIFSNTAISLDGRINTREGVFTTLGSDFDLRRMSELRYQADAVLVGGATFRNWPHPALPEPAHLTPQQAESLSRNQSPRYCVVVTRSLQVPLPQTFLREPRIRPLFLTRASAIPAGFPAEVAGYDGPGSDLPIAWILEQLKARGVQSLLVEAGGDLLFQFLAAQALTELYVTLCPKVIGGQNTPSLADGEGFLLQQIPSLSLISAQQQGDELFLHYKVKPAAAR